MNQENRNTPIQQEDKKKSSNKKWIFLSLGLAAAGTLSYFGWQYFKTNKQSSTGQDGNSTSDNNTDTTTTYTPPPPSNTSSTTPTNTSGFPLKKGSKGEKVKALQQALLNAHGKSILPKYGADSDFGTETLNALIKLNLPQVIDETTFNVLVKTTSTSIDPASLAKQLHDTTKTKNYASAIALLKTIKSTADYSAVSNAFKKFDVNGVSQTLVNGMLNTFTNEAQKQEIRMAFVAMGLKYDGDKWALAGIDGRMLITNTATIVWKDPNNSVAVPSKMVLGSFIAKRGDYIMFENEGQYFLVKSGHVHNYKMR